MFNKHQATTTERFDKLRLLASSHHRTNYLCRAVMFATAKDLGREKYFHISCAAIKPHQKVVITIFDSFLLSMLRQMTS